MADKTRTFSRRAKGLAVVFGLLFGWLAAEGMLRLLGLPEEELMFLNKDGSIEWDCYCSNPRGYFTPRTGPNGETIYCVDHSEDPPRDVDLSAPEHQDAYKILAVGDSFTWGLGVKLRDSYPLVLQEKLKQATNKLVVVSNHGQVGHWVMETYHAMLAALGKGTPDLCIYGYVLNDPLDDTRNRTQPLRPSDAASGMDNADIDDFINVRTANLEKFRMESPLRTFREYSRVMDLALRQWEWQRIHSRTLDFYRDLYDPNKNPAGLDQTWKAIASMNFRQQSQGKRFLVVIFPLFIDVDGDYPFEDVHRLIREKLQQLGVDHLDLLDSYRQYATESLWVHPLDRHPNEVAHRIAAERIAEYLLQTNALTPSPTE